jgi:hypothetical protein
LPGKLIITFSLSNAHIESVKQVIDKHAIASETRGSAVARCVRVAARLRERALDARSKTRIVDPHTAFGSQALLLSKDAVEYVVRRWDAVPGLQDIKIFRLLARLGNPVFYHAPSLVQHIGANSTWGGGFHQASDFDPAWKA